MSKNSSKVSNKNKQGMLFCYKIYPKMDFDIEMLKIWPRIWNQLFQDTMCVNVQAKRTILIFLAQICPKMNFMVGILKI